MKSTVLAVLLVGCRPTSPDLADQDVPCPPTTTDPNCLPGECPHNSPDVNIFPINGIDGEGAGRCNAEATQVVRHSLSGGGCGKGASLELDYSHRRMVGTRDGKTVCDGLQLAGSSFLVRGPKGAVTFTIRAVRSYVAEDATTEYEGYRIEAGNGSLCEVASSARVRWELGLRDVKRPSFPEPVPPQGDLVIVVAGAIYTDGNLPIKLPGTWFNLACATDNLAKLALYDLYDERDEKKNRAGLNMFSARYCGHTAYTIKGIEIEYDDSMRTEPLEAYWDGKHARCLSDARLLHAQLPGKQIPKDLPDDLQPEGCKRPDGTGSGMCDRQQWLDHVAKECGLKKCGETPDGIYTSWVIDQPDKAPARWTFDRKGHHEGAVKTAGIDH